MESILNAQLDIGNKDNTVWMRRNKEGVSFLLKSYIKQTVSDSLFLKHWYLKQAGKTQSLDFIKQHIWPLIVLTR